MLTASAIPAFTDNYIWALHDDRAVVFVDPGDATPVLAWLNQHPHTPAAILITHHHADHVDGVAELVEHFNIPVFGPEEAQPAVSHVVQDGMTCAIDALKATFKVIAVPGHTLGHLAYHGHGMLFCGDTLFSCGCGRAFEGSPAMLHHALQRLADLPEDTRVFCAHEYTLSNLAFASHVDPNNPAIQTWLTQARTLRANQRPTLPVTLGDERARNPFLRCLDTQLRHRMEQLTGKTLGSEDELFTALRNLKNRF